MNFNLVSCPGMSSKLVHFVENNELCPEASRQDAQR